jgi:hypothetical protein
MKLPFAFNLTLLYRLLLPGFLLSLGLFPLFDAGRKLGIPLEVSLTLSTILLGWLVVILDMQIYMVFEGRRYWPNPLLNLFMRLEERRLARLRQAIDQKKINKRRYLEALPEIRWFPIGESGKCFAMYPTKLGNLIYSYENYSYRIYGMDAVFYWARIWLLLNKDIREEIDAQQALADSTVYCSSVLYVFGFLYLLYSFLSLFNVRWIEDFAKTSSLLLFAFLAIMLAFLLYRISLHTHARFGDTFKAVFDIHREKLVFPGLIEGIAEFAGLKEMDSKAKYEHIRRYLQFNLIRKPGEDPQTPEQMRPLSEPR